MLNPFRTAVPFWGQTTWNLNGLSPKPDCGSKRVKAHSFFTGPSWTDRTPLVARVLYLVLECTWFWLKRIRYTWFWLPFFFYRTFMDRKNTARGTRFILGFRMYLILAQTDQIYLILAFSLLITFSIINRKEWAAICAKTCTSYTAVHSLLILLLL